MKILIDCGTHLGEGMSALIKKYNINNTEWKIFTFEPNKDSYNQVITKDFGLKNISFINKAIWVYDGKIQFNTETPQNSNTSDGAGSSAVELTEWKPRTPKNMGVGEFNNSYEVECISLSKFIKDNFSREDFIVLKLDIEGGEFCVLRDMIKTKTVSYVDHLYIEYHEWAMKSESRISKWALQIKIKMSNWKIKLTEWH